MSFQTMELPTVGSGDHLSNLGDKKHCNPKFLLFDPLVGALRNRGWVGRLLGPAWTEHTLWEGFSFLLKREKE